MLRRIHFESSSSWGSLAFFMPFTVLKHDGLDPCSNMVHLPRRYRMATTSESSRPQTSAPNISAIATRHGPARHGSRPGDCTTSMVDSCFCAYFCSLLGTASRFWRDSAGAAFANRKSNSSPAAAVCQPHNPSAALKNPSTNQIQDRGLRGFDLCLSSRLWPVGHGLASQVKVESIGWPTELDGTGPGMGELRDRSKRSVSAFPWSIRPKHYEFNRWTCLQLSAAR